MWTIRTFLFVLLVMPFAATAQSKYTVTDLGSLGGDAAFVTGVNAAGTAVGGSTDASGRLRAFVWKDGSMRSIEPPELFTRSVAVGISNSGKVVGTFDNQGSCDFPNCRGVAFVFDQSVQILPTLGGNRSRGAAISNSGYVVGTSTLETGWLRGFVLKKDAIRELGTLGGVFSEAFAVNSSGVVVGTAYLSGSSQTHAAVFRGDTVEDLGTLGGANSRALGINNAGEIVGYSDSLNNEAIRGFLVSGNQMYDLGTLGGRDSLAFGINNSSQIVGSSSTATRGAHAFLYQNGQMINLNDYITDSRWNIVQAQAISDTGIIAANATFDGLNNKAVLLTPIPE